MSNESKSTTQQSHNLGHTLMTRSHRTRRLVSPWVRRFLPAAPRMEAATSSSRFAPVEPRQAGLTGRHTHRLLNRVQRTQARTTTWKPDAGSLKPGMTDHLTRTVSERTRYRPVGVKQIRRPAEGDDAGPETDLALPGKLAQPTSEGLQRTPAPAADLGSQPRPSRGQVIPPAPRAKKRAAPQRPFIPSKSRLFSSVQEVSAEGTGNEPGDTAPPPSPKAKESPSASTGTDKLGGDDDDSEPSPPTIQPDPPAARSLVQRALAQEMPVQQTEPGAGEVIPKIGTRPETALQTKIEKTEDEAKAGKEPPTEIKSLQTETRRQPMPLDLRPLATPSPEPRPPLSSPTPTLQLQQDTAEPAPSIEPADELPLVKPEPVTPTPALEQDLINRAETKQQLPLTQPLPPIQPQRRMRVQPPAPAPTITPKTARTQLAAQGWRFKTRPGSEPATDSRRVIQAAGSLEKKSGPGKPLAGQPRAAMEGIMGRDFSGVRTHRADLEPLNVQAATKGRDVYFDRGAENYEKPESMALLGHELTHVSQSRMVQTKPAESAPVSPAARLPAQVNRDESEADRTEQTVLELARTRPGIIQRAEFEGDDSDDYFSDEDIRAQSREVQDQTKTFDETQLELQATQFEEQQLQEEENFEDLQETLEEMLDTKLDEMMETLGLDEETLAEKTPNLDHLARQILPHLKRLIAVERERRA